jgi:hypothetical protein
VTASAPANRWALVGRRRAARGSRVGGQEQERRTDDQVDPPRSRDGRPGTTVRTPTMTVKANNTIWVAVGAENSVVSCDLQILVYQATEPVSS